MHVFESIALRSLLPVALLSIALMPPSPTDMRKTEKPLQEITSKPAADSFALVKPGAVLQKISSQFSFTEGPAVDKNGHVYFTDQPNNTIWKWTNDGKLELFMENVGRANGLYVDAKGNVIACADEQNEIWCISPKKKVTVLLRDYEGRKLNGPNDLWIHPRGGLYFTDPYYQRSYWTRKAPEIKGQHVYYLPKGKSVPVPVDTTLQQPNGIIGSADGRFLYVADIRAGKTYRYTIEKDGQLSGRQLFTAMGSDGMTIDAQGNIYLTGKGVTVFNPQGVQIGHIDVPAKWTANVTFGGKDRNLLFITASESVFTLEMQVRGGGW